MTPADLRNALEAAGFTLAGQREGSYTRWYWPGNSDSRPTSILVPEYENASDYEDLMNAAIGELTYYDARGADARRVLEAVGH